MKQETRSTTHESVIGLEVHAQLLTDSKLFCACSTKFGSVPNTQICPVCTGQPGVLPVLNKRAVEFAVRAGLAMHCKIEERSIFARKNYFYPDLPKGYQISQYDKPLCRNGYIDIVVPTFRSGDIARSISITRIHLEDDAGKLLHDLKDATASHADYNRSGVPLIEIVSGPDIRTPEEAVIYLKLLRNILVYLEICDGNMQEGSFRCDANISLRLEGAKEFGTRTELKNMNSFKAIESALNYEIRRQTEVLERGGRIKQETLLWNEFEGRTVSMRGKEEAHDYRYFPEPDLPPLIVDNDWLAKIKQSLPELAEGKRTRFIKDYGIPEYDAGVLTQDKFLADYYEEAVKAGLKTCATLPDKNVAQTFLLSPPSCSGRRSALPKKLSNWIMTELLRELNSENIEIKDCKISPQNLAKLVELVETNVISGKIGKTVFNEMFKTGASPADIIKKAGLTQVSDIAELEKIIDEILANNAENVAKYKSGKVGVFGHFVGEVMKTTKGKANPKMVNEILKKRLAG